MTPRTPGGSALKRRRNFACTGKKKSSASISSCRGGLGGKERTQEEEMSTLQRHSGIKSPSDEIHMQKDGGWGNRTYRGGDG